MFTGGSLIAPYTFWKMSGIDVVLDVFHLLDVPAVAGIIDGKVWRHNRPENSPKVDVVISIPEYSGSQFNTGYLDINVHAPNVKNYKPLGTEDVTFPDLEKLDQVIDAILPLLVSAEYDLTPRIPGIPIRDKDGHWFANIRVGFSQINPDTGVQAELFALGRVTDGYGGFANTRTSVWSGTVSQVDVNGGSQLNINAGRYEFNESSAFIIPNTVTPQKNMQLQTSEGVYVINGITKQGTFWRLSVTRKDGVLV